MMDNYLERLTLEGAGGRMETDATRSAFRPAIENFVVSRFKLAIRQQNYEFFKKNTTTTIFEIELSNLNHFFP